jgi:hypothetical protein
VSDISKFRDPSKAPGGEATSPAGDIATSPNRGISDTAESYGNRLEEAFKFVYY